ncbi:MAG TPA: HAD family hydrolase [Segetibacter sp.]|jgi:phosphoglycolate phosphatase
MKVENVIFDFDGTVVDSYPGIIKAFNKAYTKVYGVENKVDLKPHIGPPVQQILTSVNGETDTGRIEQFISSFKESYDTEDFKLTELYEGMDKLLNELQKKNIKIFIATNKRHKATKLIADHLLVNNYFCGFYCSDLADKNYANKVEMVKDLIISENLNRETTVLIGDTIQDEVAAKENSIAFIYAAYGFGDLQGMERSILKPLETLNFIN